MGGWRGSLVAASPTPTTMERTTYHLDVALTRLDDALRERGIIGPAEETRPHRRSRAIRELRHGDALVGYVEIGPGTVTVGRL